MDRRQFCKTAIAGTCLFALAGLPFIYRKKDDSFLVDYLEVSIVDYCNLNCKSCAHFSPIADKTIYEYEKYKKDIKRVAQISKRNIREIALLGGEPLLHPDINKMAEVTRKYFPDSKIKIITNGLLLNSMPESFWEMFVKHNIVLDISVYNVKIDWKSILEKVQKYKVKCFIYSFIPFEREEDLDKIQEKIQKQFININLDLQGKQKNLRHCDECFTSIVTLQDSKIYCCPVISNIKYFNKYFNKNIQVSDTEYFDIYENSDMSKMLERFAEPIQFCKYCGKQFNVKWENSAHHTISEWTKV